jgi:WS/DGAT/MGAT family acyltransferase
VQRLSGNDLMELATETPGAPMQMVAVLRLARPVAPAAVRAALAARAPAVARLRQRLSSAPRACGPPFWVDDQHFTIERHLTVQRCSCPGDESALMRIAAQASVSRLPSDRPLWRVIVVTDLAGGETALVIVMHHVLADGIGGLAALAQLVDTATPSPSVPFPVPPPSTRQLLRDATRTRIRALQGIPRLLNRLRYAAVELRLGRGRDGATPRTPVCTLNRPIGPAREVAVARTLLAPLVTAAHRNRATINDLLLTAVSGALRAVLEARDEEPGNIVVSVPVSARRHASAGRLGNQVGVMPVAVPTTGDALHRLGIVASATRASHGFAQRGASAALLGPMFRLLGKLGLFTWFVNHQRLITTFVTNLRGPSRRLSFLGSEIVEIIPVTPIAGNVTVAFAALSYAGTLCVTVTVDPDRCPELALITDRLQHELDVLSAEEAERSDDARSVESRS